MMFNKISIRHLLATAAVLLTASVAKADTTWDFTSTPSDDLTLLAADGTNWTASSSTRYSLNSTINQAALTANGSVLTMTSGLLFTTTESGRLRIDVNSRLNLNGSTTLLTIPDLTAGQTVTIVFASSSSSEARTLTPDNLSSTSGFEAATSSTKQTGTGTVTADGDLTFTPDGGIYVYSLTVTDASSSEESGSTSSDESSSTPGTLSTDNSTSQSTTVNQALITASDGTVRYYNTDDLTSIDFDDANNTVTINGSSFSDVYNQLATKIAFSKGVTTLETTDSLKISEAKGWFESLYAEWQPVTDAASYTVKVKGSDDTDYTTVDSDLIRTYASDNYIRVDAVGLAAGTYEMVVAALDSDGTQIATATVSNLTVTNYSREGFAHFKCDSTSTFNPSSGVGAYKNDGTLKDDAVVVYVTADNAKTVSVTLNDTTYTGMQKIISAYKNGNVTTPLAMRIIGLVTYDDVDYFGSSSEGIHIQGISGYSEMNITIEGIGEDATIHGFGFRINNSTSVEMRNLAIMWQLDDGISIDTDNSNIWLHNIDLFYGQVGEDSDQKKGDGSIDMKYDSQYITIDHCHFWDTGKSSLCGMYKESGPNWITYHHNWFDHSDSRHARIRTMSVHMWNNYYDGCASYGIGATYKCNVFSENNYFRHTKHPFLISKQGSCGSTLSSEDGGIIKDYGSKFAETNSKSNFIPVAYSTDNTEFDYYDADTRDTQVPSTVITVKGETGYSNFDTDPSLMYTYEVDETANVPSVVIGYYGAGRLNHGSFQYTFDNDTDDTKSAVITALQTAISGYTGGVVSLSTSSSGSSGSDTDSDSDTDSGSDTDTGDDSGTTTDVTISAETECTFTSDGPSNNAFTVKGNYSTGYGTATVNGTTYSTCLKMESSTSITFTTEQVMTMTLVFSETDGNYNIKVDGTEMSSDTNVLTTTLEAGTHTLSKLGVAYLFYIGLTATTE